MLYEDRVARFRWSAPESFNFASDVIDAWARDRSRVALYWEGGDGREARFTFWDFAERSRRFANALRGLGIGRGDPVMLMLPRVPEWQVALLGALRLGAVVIPCAPSLGAKDVAFRANHSGARAIVAAADGIAEVDAARGESPTLESFVAVGGARPTGWLALDDLLAGASSRLEVVATRSDEPAVCYYGPGTTGSPRAILHGHGYTWAHRFTGENWLDLRRTDLHWTTSDTGSVEPAYGALFGPWSLGVPVLIHGGRFDPRTELELLARYQVTTFCAPATEYRLLLKEDLGRYDLTSLRHCTGAGRSPNPDMIDAWQDAVGLIIHEGYGQTETTLLVANVKGLPVRAGSMGKPFPGHDVRVIDDAGHELPAGEAGDVALRGRPPSLFLEYWKSPEETARCWRGPWYVTGERAFRDAQGYFWFVGGRTT